MNVALAAVSTNVVCKRSAPPAREPGRQLAPRTGTRYNSGMIEMPVLLSPPVWPSAPTLDPAPLLEQMATLRLENAALRAGNAGAAAVGVPRGRRKGRAAGQPIAVSAPRTIGELNG